MVENLLEEPLPRGTLNPHTEPSEFFSRCEQIAVKRNWSFKRDKEYAGRGSDLLHIYLISANGMESTLSMVSTPRSKGIILLDVLKQWRATPIPCVEYTQTIKGSFSKLTKAYKEEFGKSLRVSIGKCSPAWDTSQVDCQKLFYAQQKFHSAIEALTLGPGDVRSRLRSAYYSFSLISPDEIPNPLQEHFEWVHHELTKREERFRGQGNLDATLTAMTNKTGVKIAERIVAISRALDELCKNFI